MMAERTERTVPGPEDSDRPVWRVRQGSGNLFTFRELTTLQRWIVERKVQRDDEISADGERWKRLGNIAELASFFQVVEAADLARAQPQPVLTPMPMPPVPYYPTPVRGVAPPPPSGFPPPSFAAAPIAIPAPPAPAAPIPEHDVDLGPDLAAPPPRRRWRWGIVAVAAMAAGAAAAVVVPRLVTQPAPPAPPPVVAAVAPAPPSVAPAPPVPAPDAQPEPPPPPAPEARASPVPPARPPTPKALIDRARKLLGSGNAEAALDLFGRVATEHPDNADALSGRGLCYLDLEKWAPAEESFRSALRVDPDQPEALLGLAETYRFQGKKAEAISQYERYLARHPDGEEVEVAKNALTELRK